MISGIQTQGSLSVCRRNDESVGLGGSPGPRGRWWLNTPPPMPTPRTAHKTSQASAPWLHGVTGMGSTRATPHGRGRSWNCPAKPVGARPEAPVLGLPGGDGNQLLLQGQEQQAHAWTLSYHHCPPAGTHCSRRRPDPLLTSRAGLQLLEQSAQAGLFPGRMSSWSAL